jgi:putative glutathione S-transferase
LTTPEEAQAFLAAMRDQSHQRQNSHNAPTTMTADGMDAWYYQQRQREKDLRLRRKEAEALLRGYRGGGAGGGGRPSMGGGRDSLGAGDKLNYSDHLQQLWGASNSNSNSDLGASEHLDDPRNFSKRQQQQQEKRDLEEQHQRRASVNLLGHMEKEGEEKDEIMGRNARDFPGVVQSSTSEEERKLDAQVGAMGRRKKEAERIADANAKAEAQVPETVWRDFITNEPGALFPPERGRYHLYVSYACPGSHRALIVRALKGLQDVITVTYVHPCWRLTAPGDSTDKHRGWVFGDPSGEPFSNTIGRGGPFPAAYPGNDPDPVFDAYSIRQLYEEAQDTSGKYTIPLLWCKKLNTIVNNESSDIAYMLNSCLNDFAENPELDMYTEDDEDGVVRLNEVSEWLSPLMIHGVYRCGFARTQRAYDRAIAELCVAFDRADDILQKQRYLTGDTLTDADIRLFVTLLRFDEVYAFYFKANARLVMLTPSLLNFCRDIYQMSGIAETCNMEQIKAHFFGSHAEWNKYSVVPRGLGFMELLEMPHHRHDPVTYGGSDY